MELLFQNDVLTILSACLLSFFIVFFSIPSINVVAKKKQLYDLPNGRTSHQKAIPNLGGIAIFSGFIISSLLFINIPTLPETKFILVSSIIIFFLGLKDDITSVPAWRKLIGQIVASMIIIDLGGVRFTNLHGFLGISQIDQFTSIYLSLFIMIVIINAFNLIDGIDGLASGVGIVFSLILGYWFFLIGYKQYAILSFSLSASLFGFFLYNVFGHKNKIFMGDTGSLLLGFIAAVLIIKFNELNIIKQYEYSVSSSPAVSFAILIIPLFDTLRVFTIRLFRRQSPFKADKSHIHHLLLRLGYSHRRSTFILLLVNICFVVFAFSFQHWGTLNLGLSLIASSLIMIGFTNFLSKKSKIMAIFQNSKLKDSSETKPKFLTLLRMLF